MVSVKTTVSIPEDVFERLNQLAKEFDAPRSTIIAIALAEHFQSKRLRAQGEDPDVPEEILLDGAVESGWLTPEHVALAMRIKRGDR